MGEYDIKGGFYAPPAGPAPPNLPMRPPGQAGPEPPAGPVVPPAPKFVDSIENGVAVLVGDDGRTEHAPAQPHWREGQMTDGSPMFPVESKQQRLPPADISLDSVAAATPRKRRRPIP